MLKSRALLAHFLSQLALGRTTVGCLEMLRIRSCTHLAYKRARQIKWACEQAVAVWNRTRMEVADGSAL